MEKSGLIRRKVYSTETPVRIGYFLIGKGSALKSILDQMAIYSPCGIAQKRSSKTENKGPWKGIWYQLYSKRVQIMPLHYVLTYMQNESFVSVSVGSALQQNQDIKNEE